MLAHSAPDNQSRHRRRPVTLVAVELQLPSSDPTTSRRSRRSSRSTTRARRRALAAPRTVYRQQMAAAMAGTASPVDTSSPSTATGPSACWSSTTPTTTTSTWRGCTSRSVPRSAAGATGRRCSRLRSTWPARWGGQSSAPSAGTTSAPRASPRPPASSRSRSASCAASTWPSCSPAWPTGSTTRRRRTPRTTSWCGSSATRPDDLLERARRGGRRHQRRAAGRPRDRGRGLHRRADPGLRGGPDREWPPLLPDHRPSSRHRRARRPHGGDGGRRVPDHRRPARHVRRARPSRSPAWPAAQGRHAALAGRGRAAVATIDTFNASPTTTWSASTSPGLPHDGARAAVPAPGPRFESTVARRWTVAATAARVRRRAA